MQKALSEYQKISGFEPMYLDDFRNGEMTFDELWNANIEWLENLLADVTNISRPFDT